MLDSPRGRRALVIGAMVLATLVGCTDGGGGKTDAGNGQTGVSDEDFPFAVDLVNDPATRRLLRRCPVTRPNHNIPPGEERNPGAVDGALWNHPPAAGRVEVPMVARGSRPSHNQGDKTRRRRAGAPSKNPWRIRAHRLSSNEGLVLHARVLESHRDGGRREVELRNARAKAKPIAQCDCRWTASGLGSKPLRRSRSRLLRHRMQQARC